MPSGYAAQNFREKRREVAPPQVAPRVILSEVELWRVADKARDVPSKRNLRGLLRMTRNRIVWQYSVWKHLMDVSKMSSFRINIVLPTNGAFLPHISMIWNGYHPPFQRQITIVEKSGLVAPDFFRQHEATCHGKLEIQMFALAITPYANFPFADPP